MCLQQLVSLQNPCSFAAGPVLMAAQTTDLLRHMSSVELAKNAAGVQTDRLAALASHVIGQRRWGGKGGGWGLEEEWGVAVQSWY